MELLIFIILVALVIAFLLKKRKHRIPGYVYGIDQPSFLKTTSEEPKEAFPYRLKGPLFTVAERSFYGVLSLACADKAIVFGKVRIADILEPEAKLNKSQWQTAFNKISRKHFDYVVCEPNDLSILAVIELDDQSHNSKKQKERDALVEGACLKASLVLHRFKASNNYSVANIQQQVFPELAVSNASPDQAIEKPSIQVTPSPEDTCPRCSSTLVTRTATKGSNKGNSFIACSAYPKCRYIEPQNI
jgi:ssDNA-binding Zn-finger/Zn-ribbon topoisomerase 1